MEQEKKNTEEEMGSNEQELERSRQDKDSKNMAPQQEKVSTLLQTGSQYNKVKFYLSRY